jgi:integrase
MSLPKGVTREVLPSGNVRYRFRQTGLPKVTLPGEPFSPEWTAALEAARKGEPVALPKHTDSRRMDPRSLAALIAQYRQSHAFTEGRTASTRRVYERFFDRMVAKNGHHRVADLTPSDVRALRDSLESPHTANRYVSILSILMDYACEQGWRQTNPCRDVAKRRTPKGGFHSWTDKEIAHFMASYPEGTKPRLALMLQLDTAQRPGDVCRMGPSHLSGNRLTFRQQKTRKEMVLYLSAQTLAEIARHPLGMTFIQTDYDRPFSVKGYQQWFSKMCNRIGLRHCSAHGLRKARSRMEAESGRSTKEIQSITGHETSSEVDRYTKAASQKKLAKEIARSGLILPTPRLIVDKITKKG